MITIDKGHDIPMFSPVCSYCKHFLIKNIQIKSYRSCLAFPKGIPMEIWEGKNLHITPLKDQTNDVTFTPIPQK